MVAAQRRRRPIIAAAAAVSGGGFAVPVGGAKGSCRVDIDPVWEWDPIPNTPRRENSSHVFLHNISTAMKCSDGKVQLTV